VDVVREVRAAFPKVPLMADANSAYTLTDVDLFKSMDKYNLMMFEQPLHYEDMLDHAELQKQIETPVCLDESIHSADDARKAIRIGACRIINIKIGRVGGHREVQAVHDVCRDHGIPVWCGGMLESGIGRAHNVALSSLANFSLPGDVSASRRYWAEDIIDPAVEVSADGQITQRNEPGIGYRVKEDLIDALTVRSQVFP
jgi:O-succinylbenzoate synthase